MKSLLFVLFSFLVSTSLLAQTPQPPTPPSTSSSSFSMSTSRTHSDDASSTCNFTIQQRMDIPTGKEATVRAIVKEFLGKSNTNATWTYNGKGENYNYKIRNGKLTGNAWSSTCNSKVEQNINAMMERINAEVSDK